MCSQKQTGRQRIPQPGCPDCELLIPYLEKKLTTRNRFNIKNPAGDYLQRELNLDVVRQVSLAKVRQEKAATEAEKQKLEEEGKPADDVRSIAPST